MQRGVAWRGLACDLMPIPLIACAPSRFNQKDRSDFAAFGHQHVVGTAGRLHIHCIDADTTLGQRAGHFRMRETQALTAAEYHQFRFEFEQHVEMLGAQRRKRRDGPLHNGALGHEQHAVGVAHLVDLDVVVAIGGDRIERR